MDVAVEIKRFDWHKWLDRSITPFYISLFNDGMAEKYYRKIGTPGVKCDAILVQDGCVYESKMVLEKMASQLEKWRENNSIFDLTDSLENFRRKSKSEILKMGSGDPKEELRRVYEILTTATTFIWVTHALEIIYNKKLQGEVPKYVKEDVDVFIGDASLPEKKNAHARTIEAIRRGEAPEKIAEEFGWVKIRDGFSEPFGAEEVKQMARELKPEPPHKKVYIPPELEQLFKEVKELVYFRTSRTDVFFELFFLARPVIKRIAEFYQIPFDQLRRYTIQSLFEGKPQKYPEKFSVALYGGKMLFSEKPFIVESELEQVEVRGITAYQGKVKGTVRVVKVVSELDKVKNGDILVTQMTFPSFISAMARAAAFVTDEGGITCHAAIVAREMKKPCIIGTKVATKMLKDGDEIEVDAYKGEVRKLK